MIKKVLVFVFFISAVGIFAQGYGPQAGNISLALILGRGETFGNMQYVSKNSSNYSIDSPYSTTLDSYSYGDVNASSYNSVTNMVGVEGKYFLSSNLAVRISGLGVFSNTPGQEMVIGSQEYVDMPKGDGSGGTVSVNVGTPSYSLVESISKTRGILNFGADYYFNVGANRVFPYAGGLVNLNYARDKFFTMEVDDLGERIAEAYGMGGSVVGGVDYYLSDGLFLGLEIKAFSYLYSVSKKFPQPGLEALDADNHTYSIFSNPMLKLGFKF